jgi:hypothetical protein
MQDSVNWSAIDRGITVSGVWARYHTLILYEHEIFVSRVSNK